LVFRRRFPLREGREAHSSADEDLKAKQAARESGELIFVETSPGKIASLPLSLTANYAHIPDWNLFMPGSADDDDGDDDDEPAANGGGKFAGLTGAGWDVNRVADRHRWAARQGVRVR